MNRLFACVVCVVTAASAYGITSPILTESQKLLATDGTVLHQFGHSISIDGNTALISAYFDNNRGSVYAYEKDAAGAWHPVDKFTTTGLTSFAVFGQAVSLLGDFAVIGASQQNSQTGAAYLFSRNGAGHWSRVTQLNADEPTNLLGFSVAMGADLAVVGAPTNGAPGFRTGAVYLFSPDALNSWHRTSKLTANDQADGDWFGNDVSLYQSRVLVGAPFDDDNGEQAGSAYIFEDHGVSGWTQTAKLTPSDSQSFDSFGESVALWEDVALVGKQSISGIGGVYLFHQISPGNWQQLAKLTPNDVTAGDQFGSSVSLSGNLALVGASAKDGGIGAAYLFKYDLAGNWSQLAKYVASDGQLEDYFGRDLAISNGAVIIGAEADDDRGNGVGSAYAFAVVPEPPTGSVIWLLVALSSRHVRIAAPRTRDAA